MLQRMHSDGSYYIGRDACIPLEDEVSHCVEGFNKTLKAIASTFKNARPEEADLQTDQLVLKTHIKKMERLRKRIEINLEEVSSKNIQSRIGCCGVGLKVMKVEYAADVTTIVLSILNNLMKTGDLSSTSRIGWAALAVQGCGQILSKIGDNANAEKLVQERKVTELRDLKARLCGLERAKTMVKLFGLFEALRKGEREMNAKNIRKGIRLCGAIPEEYCDLINPEIAMAQICNLTKIDVRNLSPYSDLADEIVRVVERTTPPPSSKDDEALATGSNHSTISDPGDLTLLLKKWNRVHYNLNSALDTVNDMLETGPNDKQKLSFVSINQILSQGVKDLKVLYRYANDMANITDPKVRNCSYETELLFYSVVETIVTIVSGISFVIFNLQNQQNIQVIWITGLIIVLGPIISKINKFNTSKAIDLEIDRQLLLKVKEGKGFIEGIEALMTTLKSIEDTQEYLSPEVVKQAIDSCKQSDPFKDIGGAVEVKAASKSHFAATTLFQKEEEVELKELRRQTKISSDRVRRQKGPSSSSSMACCVKKRYIEVCEPNFREDSSHGNRSETDSEPDINIDSSGDEKMMTPIAKVALSPGGLQRTNSVSNSKGSREEILAYVAMQCQKASSGDSPTVTPGIHLEFPNHGSVVAQDEKLGTPQGLFIQGAIAASGLKGSGEEILAFAAEQYQKVLDGGISIAIPGMRLEITNNESVKSEGQRLETPHGLFIEDSIKGEELV
ncbi:MAG: hypothetical protein FJZ56_00490 [Chlamydiae bacterium]|nr:hypothetical protein [Chlamydiota bacterium]